MKTSTEVTDETLWRLAAEGDLSAEERLIGRYVRLVRSCARPYFLVGGDSEDLLQEGMIGLLTAIRQYDPDRNAVFKPFAEICIRNRLYNAIKSALRAKHTPLNGSVSLESPLFDESQTAASGLRADPEEILIARERMEEALDPVRSPLSGLEQEVLRLYLGGYSFTEIAQIMDRQPKSIDNAIQRIRKKL